MDQSFFVLFVCMKKIKEAEVAIKVEGRLEKTRRVFLANEQSDPNSPLHTLLCGRSLDTVFVE